jgi:hypothetical protein
LAAASSANSAAPLPAGNMCRLIFSLSGVSTATSQLFLLNSIAPKMRAGSQSDAAGEAIIARSAISLSNAAGE